MININFRDKYLLIGIYFSILQLFVFLRNHFLDEQILFFYYCDHIALLLAIAFFIKNIPLIKAFISSGIILQLIYLMDLIFEIGFGIPLTGSTQYLFDYNIFSIIVTLLMHLGTAFVAFAFVFKEKNKTISLLYGFIYICVLYMATITFTAPSYDMNCIFNACGVSFMYFDGYTKFWIPLGFLLLVIPAHYAQELVYHLFSKKERVP